MIKFYNVSVSFFGEKKALDNISFKVEKGEFVYITGESGSGKSTLLRLIYADLLPSRGVVLVSGKDITNITPKSIPYLRRNIGVIFQDFKLLENNSVFENIFTSLEVFYMDYKEIENRILSMMKRLGIYSRRETVVKKLSGGEKQRVAIARALINQPSIVLADEPTGNLDPERSEDIIKLLKEYADYGSSVMVATHDRYLIDKFPSRILTLKSGKSFADTGEQ